MFYRARWKVPYISPSLFVKGLIKKRRATKLRTRNSTIPCSLTSKSFYLYNGKAYTSVVVKPIMKGYKFGEFSPTRVLKIHYKKKKGKLRKKG